MTIILLALCCFNLMDMEQSTLCTQCFAGMDMLDGHDRCPSCLGQQHLEDALTNPCPDCSIMPFELRQQRLSNTYPSASEFLTPAAVNVRGTKRKHS